MSKEVQPITLEQAKKKLKTAIIVGIIGYVVITALACVLAGVGGVLIGLGFFILLLIFIFSEKKKIKRNFCPDCHLKYNYETDIEWNVISSQRVSRQPSSNRSNNATVIAEDKALVRCECVCRNCGKTTGFSKKVTVCQYYSNGNVEKTNLREYMRRYFKL